MLTRRASGLEEEEEGVAELNEVGNETWKEEDGEEIEIVEETFCNRSASAHFDHVRIATYSM